MEVRAVVLSLKENMAYVRVFKESPCAGCSGCSSGKKQHTELMLCENNKSYECFADNRIGAKVGDTVVVSSKTGFALLLAFITFLLPLLIAIASYVCADYFFSSSIPILLSFAAFLIFFFICALVSNRLSSKRTSNVICKIIEENGK